MTRLSLRGAGVVQTGEHLPYLALQTRRRLQRCPMCDYPLHGLPEVHVCPECGFSYDRNAILIVQARLSWKILAVTCGLLSLVGVVAWMMGRGTPVLYLLMGGIPGCVSSSARLLRPQAKFLVTMIEVRLLRADRPEQRFPLEGVRHARWSFVTGNVDLLGTNERPVARFGPSWLNSARRSRALAAAINHFIEQREVGEPARAGHGTAYTFAAPEDWSAS